MGSLIEQVGRLEARVSVLQTEQARGQFAAFVPGDPRSQYMRANVGPMAVSIGELARAGNDARVQLRFGNLTSADVGECTVSVSWGGRAGVDAKGRPLEAPPRRPHGVARRR